MHNTKALGDAKNGLQGLGVAWLTLVSFGVLLESLSQDYPRGSFIKSALKALGEAKNGLKELGILCSRLKKRCATVETVSALQKECIANFSNKCGTFDSEVQLWPIWKICFAT